MITTFAHYGHSHGTGTVNETGSVLAVNHYMTLVVVALVAAVALLGVILYLLHYWQPKSKKPAPKKNTRRKS